MNELIKYDWEETFEKVKHKVQGIVYKEYKARGDR